MTGPLAQDGWGLALCSHPGTSSLLVTAPLQSWGSGKSGDAIWRRSVNAIERSVSSIGKILERSEANGTLLAPTQVCVVLSRKRQQK